MAGRFLREYGNGKLILMAGLTLILGIVLSGWGLAKYRNLLLEERKRMAQSQVETVYNILVSYRDKVENNSLLEKDAKRYAIETLRSLRYNGNKSYFWITDVNSKMVLHPLNPEMEGGDLGNFKDASGQYLIREFIKTYKSKGDGFVSYRWTIKPGEEGVKGEATTDVGYIGGKSYSKIGYIKGFSSWGWIIGSGIYIDDINSAFLNASLVVGGIALVLTFFLVALFITIAEGRKRE